MAYATTITHPVEDKHMSPQEAEVVKLCITSMVDVFKSDVGNDPTEIIQSLAAVACQIIRRLAKWLPQSTDLAQLLEHDNESFDLSQPQPPKPAPMSRLKAVVGVEQPQQPQVEPEFRGDAESTGGDGEA